MSQKLEQLFKSVSQINPPEKMASAILTRIEKIQKRKLWLKAGSSFFGAFTSVLTAVYFFATFGKSILESEFWNILSLAFSDVTIVASHYQEFFFSLLETLPALTFALMLIPIFTLLISMHFISEIYNKFNQAKYYF